MFIGACPGPGRAFGGPEVPGSLMVQRANPLPTIHPPIHPPVHSTPPSIIPPFLHPPVQSIPASIIYSPTHLPSINSSIHPSVHSSIQNHLFTLLATHHPFPSQPPTAALKTLSQSRGCCWSQDVLGVLWPDHLQVLLSCLKGLR